MINALIPILVRLILAGIGKDAARQYIKDKFSGWKERAMLAVFDAAWELAEAATGGKIASLPFKDESTWLEGAKVAVSASPEWQAAEA